MYLSRLVLDPRNRAVRHALGDLQAMHRAVMAAFPDVGGSDARARHGVLWRLEPDPRAGATVLLVQSASEPDWSRLPSGFLADIPATRPIDRALEVLAPGVRLRFRLLANPTRKIDTKSGDDGARRNGHRVPLRDEAALLAWIVRKGTDAGFSVGDDVAAAARSVVVRPLGDAIGRRGRDGEGRTSRLTLRGVTFEGLLTVTDAERLRQAVTQGIGPGKAYGCGLLSLAPDRLA
jgi:CRISPR system Cascade subunit CasE